MTQQALQLRPYEQAIIDAIGGRAYDYVFEPFGGVARASRLLLDRQQARHAFVNDISTAPHLLHGVGNYVATIDESPRIQDDAHILHDLGRYANRVTISRMDWLQFVKLFSPFTTQRSLFIIDAPYDLSTETIDAGPYREFHDTKQKYAVIHDVILFRRRGENIYGYEPHDFTGPRQEETLHYYDSRR